MDGDCKGQDSGHLDWQVRCAVRISETIICVSFTPCNRRSSAALSYHDAQKALDGGSLQHCVPDTPLCLAIEQDLSTLAAIGSAMRQMRLEDGGAMTQMRDELEFAFEYGYEMAPTSVSTYTRPTAATYLKELLLQANISVAQKISSHLPELALCRRQSPPVTRKIVSQIHQRATKSLMSLRSVT